MDSTDKTIQMSTFDQIPNETISDKDNYFHILFKKLTN